MMKYKGYTGYVTFDSDAKIFHGEVIGLRAVITFQGRTPEELEQAFKDSIDDYLGWCKERSVKPEKAYSGQIRLRISPKLHARLVQEAAIKGLSLNSLINEKLKK